MFTTVGKSCNCRRSRAKVDLLDGSRYRTKLIGSIPRKLSSSVCPKIARTQTSLRRLANVVRLVLHAPYESYLNDHGCQLSFVESIEF